MPAGKARIARAGRDLTIVAYSAMVQDSLAAAEELAGEGAEIEVVDLRSIKPLDTDTVVASVARTGRLLVRGRSLAVGRGDGGSHCAGGDGRFRVAGRAAATAQCQRHADSVSSQSVGGASARPRGASPPPRENCCECETVIEFNC